MKNKPAIASKQTINGKTVVGKTTPENPALLGEKAPSILAKRSEDAQESLPAATEAESGASEIVEKVAADAAAGSASTTGAAATSAAEAATTSTTSTGAAASGAASAASTSGVGSAASAVATGASSVVTSVTGAFGAISGTTLAVAGGVAAAAAAGGGGGSGGSSPAPPEPIQLIDTFRLDAASSVDMAGKQNGTPRLTTDTSPTFVLKGVAAGLDYVIDWGNGTTSTGKTTGGNQAITLTNAYEGVDEHFIKVTVTRADGATQSQTVDLSVAEATGSQYVNGLIFGTKIENAPLASGKIPVYYTYVENPESASSTHIGYSFDEETKAVFEKAFKLYEGVINVQFIRVDRAESADLKLRLADKTLFNNSDLIFGSFIFPDAEKIGLQGAGLGTFNIEGRGWGDFTDGSDAFATIVHELGHALGLSHPHDDSGVSGIFPEEEARQDLEAELSRLGFRVQTFDDSTNSLNGVDNDQPIFSIMTYDYGLEETDGFEAGEDGEIQLARFRFYEGNASTLGSLDIAALHHIYGKSENNTGDTRYVLGDGVTDSERVNLSTIYDTGGIDTLAYDGANNSFIVLISADLDDASIFLGGFPSRVIRSDGSNGDAVVIANGVVIENAEGGSGTDLVIGNDANNRISTRSGDDVIIATKGSDTVDGGDGFDGLTFGFLDSAVEIFTAQGTATAENGDLTTFSNIEGYEGTDFSDYIEGSDADEFFYATDGLDSLLGGNGTDTLSAEFSESAVVFSDVGNIRKVEDESGTNRTGTDGIEKFILSDFDDTASLDEDGIVAAANGGTSIDGGSGTDGLELRFSNAILDFSEVSGLDNVDGIELNGQNATIDFRASDVLRLVHETGIISKAQGDQDSGALEFLVNGGSDDKIRLLASDNWQFVSTVQIGGSTYDVGTTSVAGMNILLAINTLMQGDFINASPTTTS